MAVPEYSVLIVEDRKALVNAWKRELRLLSREMNIPQLESFSASNFSEALKKCKEGCEPDLAIVDHHFESEEKNGYDVCRFLLENFPDTDIIVNTGYFMSKVSEVSSNTSERRKLYQLYCDLRDDFPQSNVIFTQKQGDGKQVAEELIPILRNSVARSAADARLRERVLAISPVMVLCLKSLALRVDEPVLLLSGEKGAGKAHLAKSIHQVRQDLRMTSGDFVTIEPPIEVESIERQFRHGGTALLENISELSDQDLEALDKSLDMILSYNHSFDLYATKADEKAAFMLILTDLEIPPSFYQEEKSKAKVYAALFKHHLRVPDLKERPEDVLTLPEPS